MRRGRRWVARLRGMSRSAVIVFNADGMWHAHHQVRASDIFVRRSWAIGKSRFFSLARHALSEAEMFVREVLWRTYRKGWLTWRVP